MIQIDRLTRTFGNVTAVDALSRIYPQANRGDYIDLAAPGVDVWAARPGTQGAYYSGPSYAVP